MSNRYKPFKSKSKLQIELLTTRNKLRSKSLKDEVEFWSCDCIVKETVWNRPEKVDHLAYKNLCVLQGSRIIKMIRNLAKSW